MSKVSCLFYRKLDKCFVEHVIKIHDMIIKMNEINEILNSSFTRYTLYDGLLLVFENMLQGITCFTIYPFLATSMA